MALEDWRIQNGDTDLGTGSKGVTIGVSYQVQGEERALRNTPFGEEARRSGA